MIGGNSKVRNGPVVERVKPSKLSGDTRERVSRECTHGSLEADCRDSGKPKTLQLTLDGFLPGLVDRKESGCPHQMIGLVKVDQTT